MSLITNSTYDFGDIVRVQGTFKDEDGNLADPSDVAIWVKAPSSTVATSTNPANPSTGVFYYDFEPGSSGQYFYRIFSDGSIQAAEEGMFRVRRRFVESTGS